MAEISDSDASDPLVSSSPQWPRSPAVDDFDIDLEDIPSPAGSASPSIEYTEDDDDDDDDEDTSVDDEEDEEEEDDEEDDDFADLDFDFDMRDVELDFGEGFYAHDDEDEGLFVDDYIDFPHAAEGHFNAIQHAFLHEIEQHLQDHWAMRSRSPDMYHPQMGGGVRDGAAARAGQQRDQLVQVEVAGQGNADGNDAAGGQRELRRPPPGADVIDLTGDDDVEMPPLRLNPLLQPSQPARSLAQRQSENARRQRSQQQNAPPRLNRSDGSHIDDQQVIVLSSSDDEDQPLRASPRRNINNHINQNIHPNRPNNQSNNNNAGRGARNTRFPDHFRRPGQPPAPQSHNANPLPPLPLGTRFAQLVRQMPLFHVLNHHAASPAMAARNNRPDDDVVITGEQRVGEQDGARQGFIGLGNIQLDYAMHPFPPLQVPPHIAAAASAAVPPKPVHVPPKPARPGFTRDTGEDVVAICPSCDQELAYDPEGDGDAIAAPARKPRSKKAQAEHHFWAVKACGHVYCKKCFENRRGTARNAPSVGFRPDSDGTKKLFCAVDDCDSEVSPKSAWVGIFM